jgi:hypothetical protein
MDASFGTSFSSSNATFGQTTSAVQPGFGFGGDPGEGFHSRQPVNVGENDWTEKTQYKDRREKEQADTTPFIPQYPRWHESPFNRYVPNVLSTGNLPPAVIEFQPEDRSKMGIPLNPFWIRNDRWSMKNEAEIFVDVDQNFVAPRFGVAGPQKRQGFARHTYLDNKEQPQYSQAKAPIKNEQMEPPVEAGAGSVTSAGAKAIREGEMQMENANPAQTHNEEPKKRGRGRPTGSKKSVQHMPQIVE